MCEEQCFLDDFYCKIYVNVNKLIIVIIIIIVVIIITIIIITIIIMTVYDNNKNENNNCKNIIGIKFITRLRLSLSHLQEHKFKHSFQDKIH